jgi:Na+-driven multidrug efflux pump
MTMVGYFIGMQEYEEARKVNLYLTKLTMACSFVICLFVFPLASLIASVYSRDAEVVRLTSELIKINAVVIPILWALSFVVPSGLRGAGDSTFTMVVSIASLWFFRVFIGYVLSIVLHFGIIGLWSAMYFDWVLRSVVYYLRWMRGKWMVSKIALNEVAQGS